MSQASNKVRWCINKAKKELEETGLHRGLIKGWPDTKIAGKHIQKAEHNLEAALYFDKGGFSDWSTSAFFYCLYHCFLAILRKFGYESRNQECTIVAIEMLNEEGKINVKNKFIDTLKMAKDKESDHSLIKLREDFQYGIEIEFNKRKEFGKLVNLCKQMINKTRETIYEEREKERKKEKDIRKGSKS